MDNIKVVVKDILVNIENFQFRFTYPKNYSIRKYKEIVRSFIKLYLQGVVQYCGTSDITYSQLLDVAVPTELDLDIERTDFLDWYFKEGKVVLFMLLTDMQVDKIEMVYDFLMYKAYLLQDAMTSEKSCEKYYALPQQLYSAPKELKKLIQEGV